MLELEKNFFSTPARRGTRATTARSNVVLRPIWTVEVEHVENSTRSQRVHNVTTEVCCSRPSCLPGPPAPDVDEENGNIHLKYAVVDVHAFQASRAQNILLTTAKLNSNTRMSQHGRTITIGEDGGLMLSTLRSSMPSNP